jgi:hypothetical protein
MKHKPLLLSLLTIFVVSCSSAQQIAQATAIPKFTETQASTSTPAATPTRIPTKTETPDIVATAQSEAFNELMLNYFDSEFANTIDGEYYLLEDSIQNLARKGYFKWSTYDVNLRNFILRTTVRMSTANNPSDLTGCGIVFRTLGKFAESIFIQQDGQILYGAGDTSLNSGHYGTMTNPAEFEMLLVVNEENYQLHIDDKEVISGESIIDPRSGGIGFAVQSGSDEEFGSQCNFTDNDLWAIKRK